MSLRLKLAITFGFVAIVTASAVALATPAIVSRGFERVEAGEAAGVGPQRGGGQGQGPRLGLHAGAIQQETTLTIILVAVAAAVGASLLGVFVAGRLVRPLGSLQLAASGVADGDLSRRSGLAGRSDEIGELGRSFDSMADALSRSDSARRRMFQDAAHELKTPLTVIDATTTAILDGVYQHDDRHLETIRQQSRLLGRTVDDLRTVSLAESGAMALDLGPLAVDQILAETMRAFAARADLAAIEFVIDITPADLVVRADQERLGQMLGALADNALRHTPRGGTITLEGRGGSGPVRLAVSDSGPGVSARDLPHLYERFYRADVSRDRVSGTSGLGLAIVHALAQAHGGSVGVENRPSGGATFWIELPSG